MQIELSDLAQSLGLTLRGENRTVSGVGTLEGAGPDDVTFLATPKYVDLLATTRAAAVICPEEFADQVPSALVSTNPYLDFGRLLQMFSPPQGCLDGVSASAFVHPESEVHPGAVIYPFAFVGPRAQIGEGSRVFPGAYVGEDCRLGRDCTLYPSVTLMAGTVLGDRVTLHSGSVLGSDGFGYVPGPGGQREKIPQVGTVFVADDVEIGANTVIDRAMLEKTLIGRGTKIDNLVQIAHNCVFGENCVIVSQVGIAGSCTVGDNVVMGGQAGIADHVDIGDNVMIGPKAGVRVGIPANKKMGGNPVVEYGAYMRNMSLYPKIPDLFKRVKSLEKELAALKRQATEE